MTIVQRLLHCTKDFIAGCQSQSVLKRCRSANWRRDEQRCLFGLFITGLGFRPSTSMRGDQTYPGGGKDASPPQDGSTRMRCVRQ